MHPKGLEVKHIVGKIVGHYSVLQPVGSGGMATVFLAEDILLRRQVAIKVLLPALADRSSFLHAFAREARVLAQLDHPNILPIYDYGQQDDLAYLIMPYVEGGSLKDKLQASRKLPPNEALPLIAQVLQALQYAHERGLVHRDVKPANLLFKSEGSLLLSDFGIVKILPAAGSSPSLIETMSRTHQVVGTPLYMAPEQAMGKATSLSDIYSAGVVLYEMLTGVCPFTADDAVNIDKAVNIMIKHLNEQPHPLRDIQPQISAQLEAVVLRALEKEPTRRYRCAADFLQALTQPSAFERKTPDIVLPPIVADITPFETDVCVLDVEARNRRDALPSALGDRILTYSYERIGQKIWLKPSSPYLSLLSSGGPITGLPSFDLPPFTWEFPQLSVKIVNNSQNTLLLSEAAMEVIASKIHLEPVLLITEIREEHIEIVNEGWGRVIGPIIRFKITRALSRDRSEMTLPAWALQEHIVQAKTFEEKVIISLKDYLPASYYMVALVGTIEYITEDNEKRCIKFETSHRNSLTRAASSSLLPPTYLYDVFLPAGRSGYIKRIPLAHQIKSGDCEHILIRVASNQSTRFDLTFSFRGAGGTQIPGDGVVLDMFVPRSYATEKKSGSQFRFPR